MHTYIDKRQAKHFTTDQLSCFGSWIAEWSKRSVLSNGPATSPDSISDKQNCQACSPPENQRICLCAVTAKEDLSLGTQDFFFRWLSFLLRTSESSAALKHFHYTDYVKPSAGIFHLSFITKCLLTQGKYQQADLGREILRSVLFALKGSLKIKFPLL